MVLKFFFWNYFLVKIFVFFGHTYFCVFFKFRSIFGNKLFFDPILQREGKKKSGIQLYHPYHKNLTSVASYLGSRSFYYEKKSKMASGSLFFTKSAILPIFDPILQREGKKSGLQLYHPYHKNLTSVASYLGYRYF